MLVDQHRTAEPVIESLLVSDKLIQPKAPALQCSTGAFALVGTRNSTEIYQAIKQHFVDPICGSLLAHSGNRNKYGLLEG